MFDRDVTVSLNADVSGYTSSLSQAIAITKQYSSAADTALGTVAKMNAALVSGLMKMSSGLTGPTKVATDTAAAYQQQLSGIQATTVVTGQSFDRLEKSTRSLARAFPIGMTQAVQQVEALQTAGVTSNKEIERLAVSFTKLGAANNSFGPELGQQMLQVTRAFGNSTAQVDALGDSLTTVSKMWGANASGVLTFSKAIAPIASTVGMSQTSVMGLSAAMSRLGEDGYLAANSFSKVLLDMNRGIREGGPELKVYADLLNMTSQGLKSLFESDPTEVLMRFTESVAKAGPEVQRTLDTLGLDGVRTTRSITALARSGDLRETVATSVGAYGSGSTAAAAEEAFSGVNDQMTRLTESMRQTVGSAGKPFLGFMEDVLKVGNKVSDVTNSIMESKPAQTLATAGIVGGVGASLLYKGLAATSLGSMVVNLLRSGRDSAPAQAFRDARAEGRAGMERTGTGAMSRLGYLAGTTQGPADPGARRASWRDRAALTARAAAGTAVSLARADANSMAQAAGRTTPYAVSPAGLAARTALVDAAKSPSTEGLRTAATATRGYGAELVRRGGLSSVIGTAGIYGREATMAAGQGIAAAGRGIGRFAGGLGITGPMAAVAGAGVLGYMMYQSRQETNDRRAAVTTNTTNDIFGAFNQFAEATGMAGKGLVDFAAAVQSATNNLAKTNTSFRQAGSLNADEAAQATSAGYQRAFNIIGEAEKGGFGSADAITTQAIATLGANATPEMVARLVADVANQTSVDLANSVGEKLGSYYESGGAGGVDIASGVSEVLDNASQNWFGLINTSSEEAAQLATLMGRNLTQQAYKVSQVYGDQAGKVASLSSAQSLYEEAARQFVGGDGQGVGFDVSVFNSVDDDRLGNVSKVLQGALGLNDEQFSGVLKELGSTGDGQFKYEDFRNYSFQDIEAAIRRYADANPENAPSILATFDLVKQRGISLSDPSYESFSERTSFEKTAYDLQDRFNEMTDTSSTLSDSLYGMNDAARAAGVTLNELGKDQGLRTSLSPTQNMVLEAFTNKNAGTVNQAAAALAQQALTEANGNVTKAAARLQQEDAGATEGTTYKDITTAALDQLQRPAAIAQAGMPQTRTMLQQVQQGMTASAIGYQSDPAQESVRQGQIEVGNQQSAAFTSMARSFLMQKAQMDVQLQQAREQAGLQMSQMQRDYNLQVQYANEDYRTNEKRATRDFNTSMSRMNRDYNTTRSRATRDFNLSQEYAEQDYTRSRRRARQQHNISMERMEIDHTKQLTRSQEDYEKGRSRTIRDSEKTRGRMVRDFELSMMRMQQDFNLQKTRATEDYQKGTARAEQDFQTSRARANRDFAKQQVQAEQDYLKSRSRSVEDFNKQLKRQIEDAAKSIYDPYKRIQAQMVMDAGQLVTNLSDQTKAISDQMKAVDQLKAMGLSQDAVDMLGLADPKNAQQAQRLLADLIANPQYLDDLNKQIQERLNVSELFVTDSDNTQQRRQLEDFQQQLLRAEEDYRTSAARAADQFATSMADMSADYQTQLSRAAEDFNTAMARMGEDFATAVTRARADQAQALKDFDADLAQALTDAADDYAQAVARMNEDYAQAVKYANEDYTRAMRQMEADYNRMVKRARKNFTQQMKDMAEDMAKTRKDAREDFNKQMSDAEEDFQKQLRRMATSLKNALSDIGAGLAISEKAAAQSLIAYGQTVAMGEQQIFEDFASYIASLPADMQENMGESMRDMLEYMRLKFPALFKEYFPNGIAGLLPITASDTFTPSPDRIDSGQPAPHGSQWDTSGMSKTWLTDTVSAMVEIGSAAGEGFVGGLFKYVDDADLPKWARISIIGTVKRELGISSPSRVFKGIGEDTGTGFMQGLEGSMPSTSWLKNLVEGIFTGPGSMSAWLGKLPSSVLDWIGKNTIFGKISDALPSTNKLADEIEDRFSNAKTWLKDLPGNVLKWIGETEIFKNVKKAFPGMSDLKNSFIERFGVKDKSLSGLAGWLSKLPQEIAGWIGEGSMTILDGISKKFPAAEKLKDALKAVFTDSNGMKDWLGGLGSFISNSIKMEGAWDPLLESFKKTMRGIILRWNEIDIRVDFKVPDGIPIWGGKSWTSPDIFPDVDPIPFATGGIVNSPVQGLVGEAGPEAIIPLNQRGAQVLADALQTYLGETAFTGSMGSPSVINVEMADVVLDFTDSGSEFSQQSRELLQRVKDAATAASEFMSASGSKITDMINELAAKLEALAKKIAEAFTGTAGEVKDATKSIVESVTGMSDALDTDLTALTSSFSTAADSIISDMDEMIADAIARLEDFANAIPGGGGGDDGDTSGGDTGGDDSVGSEPPPSTANPVHWQKFRLGYKELNASDKTYIDGLFGGAAPTEESFKALSSGKQVALATAMINSIGTGTIASSDRAAIDQAFGNSPSQPSDPGTPTPPGGPSNPGTPEPPAPRDLSYNNFSTLQSALGDSDQKFLTSAFGGAAPKKTDWNALSESKRDKLIAMLEDKDLSKDDRDAISNMKLPNLGSGTSDGGEEGDGLELDQVKKWWGIFKTGYGKLGKNDTALVDEIFGGKPTYDLWLDFTEGQQKKLRDILRDGNIGKDEIDTLNSVDPYKVLGQQLVKLAEAKIGAPYVVDADGPDSFDCSGFTSYLYSKVGKSIPSYSDTQWGMGREVSRDEAKPGDLVFFSTGRVDNGYRLTTGHVGLYAGNGQMIDANVPDGVKYRGAFNSQFHGVRRYFAEGGIVNRRHEAVIGEAGPEMVLPLNEDGATFFADVMARYANPLEARQAMVSPYSTPITMNVSQTYDNRTMFTGSIEVKATNPDEFAAKAAAKQRRQRLSQPVGSAR